MSLEGGEWDAVKSNRPRGEEILEVTCPRCHAKPFEYCDRDPGEFRRNRAEILARMAEGVRPSHRERLLYRQGHTFAEIADIMAGNRPGRRAPAPADPEKKPDTRAAISDKPRQLVPGRCRVSRRTGTVDHHWAYTELKRRGRQEPELVRICARCYEVDDFYDGECIAANAAVVDVKRREVHELRRSLERERAERAEEQRVLGAACGSVAPGGGDEMVIAELRARVAELEARDADKDRRIARLTAEVDGLQAQADRAGDELGEDWRWTQGQ